ncbi:hypothetical protein ASPWEDRAFT_623621 [Aspergillus wentii DTO 134E9]|uniref:Uncharacterized protein n=1 Tax=Aspergillus wentii DTO 134E9 TaxID=1073089 RepID=A0A1L9RF08_ASPWE|nr:uncharacterized protein ASPWEDRAFT_623621 [Aspergillus wentii DTO 134E9]OJJ33500.1 hypothetical protein ASPWEDRAFT_623621 [Aspergillus wentii DTO 134E9]
MMRQLFRGYVPPHCRAKRREIIRGIRIASCSGNTSMQPTVSVHPDVWFPWTERPALPDIQKCSKQRGTGFYPRLTRMSHSHQIMDSVFAHSAEQHEDFEFWQQLEKLTYGFAP